jgi:hypothetical protein
MKITSDIQKPQVIHIQNITSDIQNFTSDIQKITSDTLNINCDIKKRMENVRKWMKT